MKLGLPGLVVPTGRGNDFARALGLRRVRDALTAWRGLAWGSIAKWRAGLMLCRAGCLDMAGTR